MSFLPLFGLDSFFFIFPLFILLLLLTFVHQTLKQAMDKTEIYCKRLREAVADRLDRDICGHNDFILLSERIELENIDVISPTTLKRFWGYFKDEHPTPQTRTLNVLSKFVGYKDFQSFSEHQDHLDNYSSEFVKHDTQHCFLMQPNERIEISWYPKRRIVLKHEGDNDLFSVVESKNSKLAVGMTVHCESFVMKQPLWLKNVRGTQIDEPCDYVCGKVGGISFRLLGE